MLLVGFEEGKKVAEVDVDKVSTDELAIILELWDEMGRTYEYQLEVRAIKPYKWPRFDKGEEVER